MRVFVKGGAWTNAEDEALKALVQKVGLNRWASISTSIGHKSPEQCQQRWVDFLDPAINKGEWTQAEKRKLVQLYEVFPEQWQSIASQLAGRRHWQCKVQYATLRDGGKIAGEKGDEDVVGSADGEIVGAGDYKLYHEMRAAKADTIDGDEYSRQVTEFTRTRLANQKGKKQLRKEKEIMLAQTQMLSALERRREMEAAGIETHTQKKAFRKAVEEDAKGRQIARGGDDDGDDADAYDDDEDDGDNAHAEPVVADLADIINANNTSVRSAGSRKKTMLLASDVAGKQRAKEVALVPDFAIGTAPAAGVSGLAAFTAATPSTAAAGVSTAAPLLAGAFSSASVSASAAAATPTGNLLQQRNTNDALSALMAHYMNPAASSAAVPVMVGAGGDALAGIDLGLTAVAPSTAAVTQQKAPAANETSSSFLDFDDMPAPQQQNAAAPAFDPFADDDMFGDLPAPSAAVATADDVPSAAAAVPSVASVFEDDNAAEEDDEEGDDEEEEEENYMTKALSLLASESRIHWDAAGDWDSGAQQTDYLKQARALIDGELSAMMDPLSIGANDDITAEERAELLPALIHPRVSRLMEAQRDSTAALPFASSPCAIGGAPFKLQFPLITAVLEDEIEAEVTKANCAQDMGIVSTSSDASFFTINDAPAIVKASAAVADASAAYVDASDALAFYTHAYNVELGEAARRRVVQKGPEGGGLLKVIPTFAAAVPMVQPHTKRPREEGGDAVGPAAGSSAGSPAPAGNALEAFKSLYATQ